MLIKRKQKCEEQPEITSIKSCKEPFLNLLEKSFS